MTRLLLKTTLVAAGLAFPTFCPSLIAPVWSGETGGNVALPSVGEKAPDFSLQDFKGKEFTLSKLEGKKAVLLWFTNLCGGCQSKFGEMENRRKEWSAVILRERLSCGL